MPQPETKRKTVEPTHKGKFQHFCLGLLASLTEQPVKAKTAERDWQSNSGTRLKYLASEPQKGALTV